MSLKTRRTLPPGADGGQGGALPPSRSGADIAKKAVATQRANAPIFIILRVSAADRTGPPACNGR